MQYKYGNYPEHQVHGYKKRLHSLVHWLLIYAEEKNPNINNYFDTVQCKFEGFNELMNYPTQIVEIMNYVESARLEYGKENYSHERYRKIILDVHDLIDKLPEVDNE